MVRCVLVDVVVTSRGLILSRRAVFTCVAGCVPPVDFFDGEVVNRIAEAPLLGDLWPAHDPLTSNLLIFEPSLSLSHSRLFPVIHSAVLEVLLPEHACHRVRRRQCRHG